MSKIKYEIFDTDAEVVAFDQKYDASLELILPADCDGFLSIDGVVVRLNGGIAHYDLRYIADGEHTPHLVLGRGRIILPKIKKCGKLISLCECDSEYIRGTSIRERRLARRVRELEDEIEQLKRCIYGTKIL
ncbi:MAG: hypothetical protein IJW03_04260 [Clostridia bacterium]|nr:hypothetical protein [Clostridia bacterium]